MAGQLRRLLKYVKTCINKPEVVESPKTKEVQQVAKSSDDSYTYKSKSTQEIIGAVAPMKVSYSEEITPEKEAKFLEISEVMQEKMFKIRDEVFAQHTDLKYLDKTYIVLDACAAVMAEWGCSMQMVEESTMDIGSAIQCSCEMLQHNFHEKQKELYRKVGGFTH